MTLGYHDRPALESDADVSPGTRLSVPRENVIASDAARVTCSQGLWEVHMADVAGLPRDLVTLDGGSNSTSWPSPEATGLSDDQEPRSGMRRAVFGIIAACGLTLVGAPTATADPPPGVDAIRTYPLARGIYSSPDPGDFYKVFFKTPDGRFCGISPNGGDTGCDAVPIDAPGGTNETVAASSQPGQYQHSDTARFTRVVDVLPEGHRLENWCISMATR